ncbi:SRPBCC family protein [Kribbella sp. CA-294648]|uniref:SRPBCC family protein n=1 Tax=Kribbella sp. CA-294648 TaxID=3239948 RepID=UPI003D8F3DDE
MTAFVRSVDIGRPAAEVFAYATDPGHFPEWQRDVARVDVGGHEVGSRFVTVRKVAGAERGMTQEITENAPPRRWAARGVDGPILPSATIEVEPLGVDRCRVTFGLDFDGRGVAAPLAPVVRRIAAKAAPASYQRLKEKLESS